MANMEFAGLKLTKLDMNKLKYIVDEIGGFAIFPGYIDHDTIGNLMSNRTRIPNAGAGFISFFDGTVHCYGESISLGLKSRGAADDIAIANALDLKPAE